jgi:hypothetical protein
MDVSRPDPDESLHCLSELARSADELRGAVGQLIDWMTAQTSQAPGSHARRVPLDQRLTLVEEISQAVRALSRNGSRFRRLEARALYAEGLTMAQLAAVLGVTRQRASVLLHEGREVQPGEPQVV